MSCVMCESDAVQLRPAVDVLVLFTLLYSLFPFPEKIKTGSNINLNLNKVPDFLFNFKEIWTVSRYFNKILQYQISRKSVQWKPIFFFMRTRKADG